MLVPMSNAADVSPTTRPTAGAASPTGLATGTTTTPSVPTWPLGLDALGYGGDYNPEQWPDEIRLEDIALMREAGVNLISLAIFSWARIEPTEGVFDWEWLDVTMDRLHEAGIRVDLATATASPPPWLTHKHPEILPVTFDGTVLAPGSRQHYRISSPIFRRYAVAMTRRIAERYADHPGLAMWHIDNEIGCHAPHEFSDDGAAAFRAWLEARYGTIAALNDAWGTAFWSQLYSSFDEIQPPRAATAQINPTQQLDFARYSSDELLSYYRDLRAVLAEVTPGIPCTTNFMVMRGPNPMDYYSWAPEMDIVSNDHYLWGNDPFPEREIAFSADMVRSMAGGAPWILMEHSTSAVNWQPVNRSRAPHESLRNSLSHLAHGADALLFFQWRASRAGAEKYHSAMYPHAGRDSDVWRTTVQLGDVLRRVGEIRGSRVRARAAVLYDYASRWATVTGSQPNQTLDVRQLAVDVHSGLARRGVETDVVEPSADLSGYDLVVVPALYLISDADAAAVVAAAERGATVLVTFYSGIVDEHDHVRLGGYPGAFRDLLGVHSEEFWALQPGQTLTLDDGSIAHTWAEKLRALAGTDVVRTIAGGDLDGVPALTRREVGDGGSAWYLPVLPDSDGLQQVLDAVVARSGVVPVVTDVPDGVEVTRRHADDGRTWLFVLNHTRETATVALTGRDLVAEVDVDGSLELAPGAFAVVREG